MPQKRLNNSENIEALYERLKIVENIPFLKRIFDLGHPVSFAERCRITEAPFRVTLSWKYTKQFVANYSTQITQST